jgi:KaiC/GvpD/RAD55 family RecA-like ATPase
MTLNLASALFKRILEEEDFDTWSSLRRHYLPSEYHVVYDIIDKQIDSYHKLPTIEELKLAVRDASTLDKIYAIEAIEVDAEPFLLLDYLKNEFTQKETLFQLHKYVEHSITFETAEETLESLYNIISRIEDRVELKSNEDNLQKLNLFESDEDLADYIPLGLNSEFDKLVRFKSTDYILMGGKRGSGKSITCSNLANTVYERGKSVLYFSIEMPTREILQRQCSIGSGVPHSKIKYKTLDNLEWLKVATWWAGRYKNGEAHLEVYKKHRDFDKFHAALQKEELKDVQIDIIYDPVLTLPKLRAEIIKRVRKLKNVGLIIVDYVNQIKRTTESEDKFDWKDQIVVSTTLKSIAGELGIPVFSPYQIDASGEARFAKGILDSADAAFTLEAGPSSIAFTCTKMRGDAKINFTSKAEWNCLRIGPDNGEEIIIDGESSSKKTSFKKKSKEEEDTKPIMDRIYDDPPF